MINVELLEEVMQQIKDHPEQHKQSWWFTKSWCGTAMCFAGWACYLSGWQPLFVSNSRQGSFAINKEGVSCYVRPLAIKLLGLGENFPELFNANNTVEDLERLVKDLVNKAHE